MKPTSVEEQDRALRALGDACPVCGEESKAGDPLVLVDGVRVHQSHTTTEVA